MVRVAARSLLGARLEEVHADRKEVAREGGLAAEPSNLVPRPSEECQVVRVRPDHRCVVLLEMQQP